MSQNKITMSRGTDGPDNPDTLSFSQVLDEKRNANTRRRKSSSGKSHPTSSMKSQYSIDLLSESERDFDSPAGNATSSGWTNISYNNDLYRFVQPRRLSSWVGDDSVTSCYKCDIVFTLLNRRHHCQLVERAGESFATPALLRKQLSRLILKLDQCQWPQERLTEKTAHIRTSCQIICGPLGTSRQVQEEALRCAGNAVPCGKNLKSQSFVMEKDRHKRHMNLQRVCDDCAIAIQQRRHFERTVTIFELCEFDVGQLRILGQVCREWRTAALIFTSGFRQIQYYLPGHQLTARESRMVWINRRFLAGHSKWLLQLLKAVDWTNEEQTDELVVILGQKRRCSCMLTMCSRLCEDSLSAADAMELLSHSVQDIRVREIGVYALRSATSNERFGFLPLLAHNLRFEPQPAESALGKYLLETALQYPRFLNDLYWWITVNAEDYELRRKYDAFKQRLLVKLTMTKGRKASEDVVKGQDLAEILWSLPTRAASDLVGTILADKLESSCLISTRNPALTLPIDAQISVGRILCDQIDVKNSAEAPLVIPCEVSHPNEANHVQCSVYKFLYKRSDLRKDAIVQSLIGIMNDVLRREISLHVPLMTYRVQPLSSKDGMLEIVQDAETLYFISKHYGKLPIIDFLMQHNGHRTMGDILSSFSQTLAVYTIITFLLGVGDRHLNNVMMKHSGEIFHIDYGFILGRDPKLLQPPMRLDSHMIAALGGHDSKEFQKFRTTCVSAYNCLRRHVGIFYSLLALLVHSTPRITDDGYGYSEVELQAFIVERFLLGQSDDEAARALQKRMDGTLNEQIGRVLSDFVHEQSREGTIMQSLSNVGSSVFGAVTVLSSVASGYIGR